MPDSMMLICTPTSQPAHGVVETLWCDICACEVWVSVPMDEEVKAGRIRPVCTDCAVGVLEAADDQQILIHPKQRAGLAKAGLLSTFERIVALNNERKRG